MYRFSYACRIHVVKQRHTYTRTYYAWNAVDKNYKDHDDAKVWAYVRNPITGLDRPLGLQEVEAPRFLDNRHMKMVRLSDLRTGSLYPPGKIPGTHFC
jgi:hypothetical protein